ncbi:MAG: TlpA disulfide reductase family protein [Pyrinomonadaceae bacterium]
MRFLKLRILFFLTLSITVFGQQNKTKSTAEVSMNAPPFTATAMSGKTYKLADLKGKVVVINFWSTRCVNCVDETPDLNALVDSYQGKEVIFLAFAHDAMPNVQKFLKKNPFRYDIIPAGLQEMIVPYGEPIGNGFFDIPFPTHILIDKDGIIQVNQIGSEGIAALRRKLSDIFKNP